MFLDESGGWAKKRLGVKRARDVSLSETNIRINNLTDHTSVCPSFTFDYIS